ncbi:hypothetical protein ALC62_03109, partial [Cyphomyrmex costatus]
KRKINIVTTNVAAALDRCNISDRKGAFIISACAKALGCTLDDISISRSTIKRQREKARTESSVLIKQNFKPDEWLVVHWDGKILPETSGTSIHVDKLAITVSGANSDKLLGIISLERSTGEAQADAVIGMLKKWNLESRIIAMSFDTTAANTGPYNGACVLIESQLKSDLLYLACRHHMYELVLRSIFEASIKTPVNGPNVGLYKRFQQSWSNIDTMAFETGISEINIASVLSNSKDDIIAFCIDQLKKTQPREDYREFLELVIIFLGGIPSRGILFRAPGAVHDARWMSKALYSLKIYMYKSQFQLTPQELSGLRDVCIFIVQLFVKAWFTAPNHDLQFLKSLIRFENINKKAAQAAVKKFTGHLWYLNEELVGLAFFDSTVSSDTKEKMVAALKSRNASHNDLKRPHIKDVERWSSVNLENLVSSKTFQFFNRFHINVDFLSIHPSLWECNNSFKHGKETVVNLKVINDVAERAVALAQCFNGTLTKNYEQKQHLFQVVTEHRRSMRQCTKNTLNVDFKYTIGN